VHGAFAGIAIAHVTRANAGNPASTPITATATNLWKTLIVEKSVPRNDPNGPAREPNTEK
jgi:hypothetical protein